MIYVVKNKSLILNLQGHFNGEHTHSQLYYKNAMYEILKVEVEINFLFSSEKVLPLIQYNMCMMHANPKSITRVWKGQVLIANEYRWYEMSMKNN